MLCVHLQQNTRNITILLSAVAASSTRAEKKLSHIRIYYFFTLEKEVTVLYGNIQSSQKLLNDTVNSVHCCTLDTCGFKIKENDSKTFQPGFQILNADE